MPDLQLICRLKYFDQKNTEKRYMFHLSLILFALLNKECVSHNAKKKLDREDYYNLG